MWHFSAEDSDESEAPRKRGPSAPKPVEFHVVDLQAGNKEWHAGSGGDMMTFPDQCPKELPAKEVILLGKVLFGRQRFAFEVQELDRRPAAVRRILKRAEDIDEARFGPSDFGFGHGNSGDQGQRGLSWLDAWKACNLAEKHSIQVKFQDIEKVDVCGSEVTLVLSKAPQCYVKPEGEPAIVNMEVAKDITGGARSIKFRSTDVLPDGFEKHTRLEFSKVRPMVAKQSPRMDALFRGEVPAQPVPTPARKRKSNPDESGIGKKQRADPSKVSDDISAPDGSLLKQAVDQFKLTGIKNEWVSNSQWKQYIEERESLEVEDGDDEEEAEEEEREEDEEVDGVVPASKIIPRIRSSVVATLKSTALKLDAAAFARGVFLLDHDREPRTVESHARIYAPNATGNFVDLFYRNHHRARMSFTERFSELYASCGGPGMKLVHPGMDNWKKKCDKIFELDYNEYRRKNQVKRSLATNATLSKLGVHLFGAAVLSNRKVFGLLVRSAGLGKFGEINGWPIAMARRRFKCGKGEVATDTESIPGDKFEEDANLGECCIM